MPEAEFPDELDLALRQKLFIVRLLLQNYHDGMSAILDAVEADSERFAEQADQTDAVQWAWVAGYSRAHVDIKKHIDSIDWEGLIIGAQADLLLDHKQKEDDDDPD